ncbi:MAG TPA: type IV pilin protein [Nevskiaceae bacterium]|nr:type IV pilin protein [Nevskiaceae bacterium]
MKRARGFTLIELMIVVVVIGVLLAIGIPSYHAYTTRTHRALAKSSLTEIVSKQESWYADHKGYATALSKLGYDADTLYLSTDQQLLAASSSNAVYKITLAGEPASTTCPPGGAAARSGFTVVAEPIEAQADDTACGRLCVSSLGTRSASGSQGAACWKR